MRIAEEILAASAGRIAINRQNQCIANGSRKAILQPLWPPGTNFQSMALLLHKEIIHVKLNIKLYSSICPTFLLASFRKRRKR
jgi:hypothetical protein